VVPNLSAALQLLLSLLKILSMVASGVPEILRGK